MPKRFRLTRRFPVAMTEDGYRRLKTFAKEAGLEPFADWIWDCGHG